jgi:hypothetical protein
MTTPSLPPNPTFRSGLRPIEDTDLTGFGSDFVFAGDDDLDWQDYELGWGDRIRLASGRMLIKVGWLALALGLALGSAGIVAATQHLPATGTRPELTWSADQALANRLDAGVKELGLLKQDVDSLSVQARAVLSSVTQVNQVTLKTAWDSGSGDLNSIDAEAADLDSRFDCTALSTTLPDVLAKQYSQPMIDRYEQVCDAVSSVAPIHDDWQAMVDGSQTAFQVVNDIEAHDSIATDALKLATQGRYADAIVKLVGASAALSDAQTVAAQLSTVTDTSTLTTWLTRTQAWDDAARLLWQTTIDNKGAINAQVTAALRNEANARALLPDNNNVLQVVMYEVAGNMTSNGISIETARGALNAAMTDLTGGSILGS